MDKLHELLDVFNWVKVSITEVFALWAVHEFVTVTRQVGDNSLQKRRDVSLARAVKLEVVDLLCELLELLCCHGLLGILLEVLGVRPEPLALFESNELLLLLPQLVLHDPVGHFILGNLVQVVVHEVLIQLFIDINIKQAWFLLALVEVVLVGVEEILGLYGSWLNRLLLRSKMLLF